MVRHTWSYRLIPPFIIAVVFSCVWYAVRFKPAEVAVVPTTSGASLPKSGSQTSLAVQNAAPVPTVSPTVKKLGSQLEFSVKDVPYKQVNKVEFYIEQHMVGAAFSEPYSVTVSENSLTAGSHTVVARIYTTTTTASSSPASFVAKPATSPAPAADKEDMPKNSQTPPPTASGPTKPSTLAAPTNLAGSATEDGSSATITWSLVQGATSYSVRRDGLQVATATGTGYTDTGLTPGQTYDYQVVAVADNASSAPSSMLAVTMPDPHVLGEHTDQPGFAPHNGSSDSSATPATN